MSMKPEFFCCIGAELKDEIAGSLKSSRIFMYRAAESQTISDMLVDGFFNEADDLRVNDLILLYCPEKTRAFIYAKVSSVAGGVVKTTIINIDPQDIPIDTTSYSNISGSNLKQVLDSIDAEFSKYLKLDGSTTMTGVLKMRASASFECAVAPYWHGVGLYKLNDNDSVTLMASIEYNSGFEPATTNTYNIGASARKWKNLYLAGKAYVATINNGADLSVPNKSGTLATMGDVELAARSGRMLTDQGKWYAKMYSSSTVPTGAEYDGRNYADFSQVDQDNNPIIVIYEGQNGNWVQSETITPPAEYDGYVSITSKIWDIVEQSGQQGGRVLWNHTSKEFTPEPRIVSTNDIEVTGDSTVIMPLNPSGNQIVNKDYVDSHVPTGGYHPSLFAHEWDDKLRDDVQWLRADTFSWQDGSVYKAAYNHLADDVNASINRVNRVEWRTSGTTNICYTRNINPQVGDSVYSNTSLTTKIGVVKATGNGITVSNNKVYHYYAAHVSGTVPSETIAGVQVKYFLASDGHKICLATQESNVASIYSATGVAWYYILDPENQRFKLPRTQYNEVGLRDTVGKYVPESVPNITATISGTVSSGSSSGAAQDGSSYAGDWNYGTGRLKYVYIDASEQSSAYQNDAPVQQRATQMYLYFYVGSFTQTAIENTAGLNASLFNNKADLDLNNVSAGIDFVVESQLPTVGNNYTWYRKYKSGWVEQGGQFAQSGDGVSITLPITMANTNYSVVGGTLDNSGAAGWRYANRTTTGFTKNLVGSTQCGGSWEVRGMAA